MKFKSVLRKLIIENIENKKLEYLQKQYLQPTEKALAKNPKAKAFIQPMKYDNQEISAFDVLKAFIFADPTTVVPPNFDKENTTESDMKKVKVGTYVEWLLKNFIVPALPEEIKSLDPKSEQFKNYLKDYKRRYFEDLFKQYERLEYFDKVKKYKEFPADKKDIVKLTSDDLYDIFLNFKEPERKVKEKEKSKARKTREGFKHAGGNIIYEGNDWVVIEISDKSMTGKDAAIYYGGFKDIKNGESDWCTSGPNLTYFEGYIKDGPLYVIFPQDDKGQVGKRTGLPTERYQFHFPSNQFMNKDDRRIDLADFFNNKAPELKDMFKKLFGKGLVAKTGDKVEIKYPGHDLSSIFIGIYGFEELFDSLPTTIEKLSLINTSSNTLGFKIPESLGKFTNLTSLAIENFAETLPNVFDNFPNLTFLSLTRNKKLKELPPSFNSLDALDFINLRETSPDLIIPQEFKERMNDEGDGFYYIS